MDCKWSEIQKPLLAYESYYYSSRNNEQGNRPFGRMVKETGNVNALKLDNEFCCYGVIAVSEVKNK